MCFIIATFLFIRERQKRHQPDLIVPSKYLWYSSYSCIAMGSITTGLYSIWYIPVLCIISDVLIPMAYLQTVAMECYQLSRLYYCFSKNQVHSNKGYPNWVFAALFTVLIFWLFSELTTDYSRVNKNCRFKNDGNVEIEKFVLIKWDWYWHSIVETLYIVLEVTTVSLYWYKVQSFQRNQTVIDRAVYNRVQSILHRVLILTFFYLLIWILVSALWVVTGFWMYSLVRLSISYSMFLMQDHNTSEYVTFLRFVKRYRCCLCLCCLNSMVREQHRMLVENAKGNKDKKEDKENSVQTANTRNISADIVYGNPKTAEFKTGMELSVATRTEIVNTKSVESDKRVR